MNDTPHEFAALVRSRIMAKTGAERFIMGCRMHEAARAMTLASFPKSLTSEQRRERLYERFYGKEPRKGKEADRR